MSADEHIKQANRIAKSIKLCYSAEIKRERKLLVLAHIRKACQLRK